MRCLLALALPLRGAATATAMLQAHEPVSQQYRHPPGSAAYEWTSTLPDLAWALATHGNNTPLNDAAVQVKKPTMGGMPMEH